MRTTLVPLFWLIMAGATSAQERNRAYEAPRATRGTQLELKNLAPGSGCVKIGPPLAGKVVKREFRQDGLLLSSFVLEQSDGQRTNLNVSPNVVDDLSMTERGGTMQTMQRVTRIGGTLTVDYVACGASGRVLMVDRIWGR